MKLLADTARAARSAILLAHDSTAKRLAFVKELTAKTAGWAEHAPAAAALEQYQRSQGFSPVLTAEQAHNVWLHIQKYAAGPAGPEKPRSGNDWIRVEAGLSANKQLIVSDPENAAFIHMMQGDLLMACQPRSDTRAVSHFRKALQQATEQKGAV